MLSPTNVMGYIHSYLRTHVVYGPKARHACFRTQMKNNTKLLPQGDYVHIL